jgi:hypothetical protein
MYLRTAFAHVRRARMALRLPQRERRPRAGWGHYDELVLGMNDDAPDACIARHHGARPRRLFGGNSQEIRLNEGA